MNTLTRKEFIRTIGISAAALTLHGVKINFAKLELPKIGLQLYTVRKHLEKSFEDTIKKIASIGYYGVETYTLPENITLNQAAKIIKSYKLEVLAMHSELPVDKNRDFTLKMADAYNSNIVVYHGWPQDDKYKTKDSIKRTAELYNEISYFLRTKGLTFALHNHWWEFEKHNDYYPFYYLLENLDKDIIFEIDTYWAKTAGYDPVKAVKDFGARAPLLHIKDGNAIKGEESYKQVPAGKGVMNFPEIINSGIDTIKWLIVEFDEYSNDIFSGIKDSYEYLYKNNLGTGKIEVKK